MNNVRRILLSLILSGTFAVSYSAFAAFPETLDEGVVFIDPFGKERIVAGFPVTSTLEVRGDGIDIFGQRLLLDYSKASGPGFWRGDENGISANAWGFVKIEELWYGGTWEWMREGNILRSGGAFVGPKHLRFAPLQNFRPVVGEIYGFMVTPTVRGAAEPSVRERSEVAFYRYGVGPVPVEEVFPPEKPVPTAAVNLLLDDEPM